MLELICCWERPGPRPRALLHTDHWTRRRGDIETNDTSAATDTRQHETTIATATAHAGQHETTIATARHSTATIETDNTNTSEKHAKNTHFSPAKAMSVSTRPPHRPAKAMAVSHPHRHQRAKAMAVSDNHTHGLQAPVVPPAGTYAPTPQKTRMQFDWVKFQRSLKTLQFQRSDFKI